MNREQAIAAVIDRMNDGSLIDRHVMRDSDGYSLTDRSVHVGADIDTIKIPCDDGSIGGDLTPTAEAILDQVDANFFATCD